MEWVSLAVSTHQFVGSRCFSCCKSPVRSPSVSISHSHVNILQEEDKKMDNGAVPNTTTNGEKRTATWFNSVKILKSFFFSYYNREDGHFLLFGKRVT